MSNDHDAWVAAQITRRDLVIKGGGALAAVAGAGFLAACGTGSGTGTSAAGGTPVRGGTLKVGMLGGGGAETVNPLLYADVASSVRVFALYDRLFVLDDDLRSLVPQLATSMESDATARVWTLHLRDGVRFHDGKRFGADDVIHSLRLWADPRVITSGGVPALIDMAAVRKRGPLTVEIPLLAPVAQFDSMLTAQAIVQDGAKMSDLASKDLGTGPFKLKSFQAGRQSVFSANRDYWQHGKPYVDRLIVDSSYGDEPSRMNALLSGQVDVAPMIPAVIAKQQEASRQVKVLRAQSNAPLYFAMRKDVAPFHDARVRQALRLVADRRALVEGALNGYGTVGNDTFGVRCEYFAEQLTRQPDVEQARSLLKAAGHSGLTVTVKVADFFTGARESAELYAQQAKAAGINVQVDIGNPGNYFQPASGWPYAFGQDGFNVSFGSLTQVYSILRQLGETGPKLVADARVTQAMATNDKAKANELWLAAQRQEFDSGGYLVWAQADVLDAVAPHVGGLATTPAASSAYKLENGWITA